MLFWIDDMFSYANAGDLTFISIREVHTLSTTDTRITDAPHSGFTHLASVVHWTGAGEVIECDRALASIQTRLHLRKRAKCSFNVNQWWEQSRSLLSLTCDGCCVVGEEEDTTQYHCSLFLKSERKNVSSSVCTFCRYQFIKTLFF